jgi:hypothetical protein
MIGNGLAVTSGGTSFTVMGYDEQGFQCLDEECPECTARALIINEWGAAECLTCSWRNFEPPA